MSVQIKKYFSMSDVVSHAVNRSVYRAVLAVEGKAILRCPVDTGRLRGAITHRINDDYGEVGTNVFYAPYIEFGTRYIDARPFLRPAADEVRAQMDRILKEEMRRAENG